MAKVRLTISYRPAARDEVIKTFLVSQGEAAGLEAVIRLAFAIPSDLETLLLIEDVVCYPIANLDLSEAAKARVMLQTFPRGPAALPSPLIHSALQHVDKEDKRKHNKGLAQRRSYLKEEKMLVMFLKDSGRSAEDISQLTGVSKSNVEKWCADRTRATIIDKYRATCADEAFVSAFAQPLTDTPSALGLHFSLANGRRAASYLLDKLRQFSHASPLLAVEGAILGHSLRIPGEGMEVEPQPRKRSRSDDEDAAVSRPLKARTFATPQIPAPPRYSTEVSDDDDEVGHPAEIPRVLCHQACSFPCSVCSPTLVGWHMAEEDVTHATVPLRELRTFIFPVLCSSVYGDTLGAQHTPDFLCAAHLLCVLALLTLTLLQSLGDDVALIRSVAKLGKTALTSTYFLGGAEEVTMQYNAPLDMGANANVQATRPMLINTRHLSELREKLRANPPSKEEEEDRAVMNMLGE